MSARRELARSEEANQKLQRDVKEVGPLAWLSVGSQRSPCLHPSEAQISLLPLTGLQTSENQLLSAVALNPRFRRPPSEPPVPDGTLRPL